MQKVKWINLEGEHYFKRFADVCSQEGASGVLLGDTARQSCAGWLRLFLFSVTALKEGCVLHQISLCFFLFVFFRLATFLLRRHSQTICTYPLMLVNPDPWPPARSSPQAPFHHSSQSLSRHTNICSARSWEITDRRPSESLLRCWPVHGCNYQCVETITC